MMGMALCCVWAAYTTTELPKVAKSTIMSPEVAADAAEPQGVVILAAVLSEAMALAAASSEVAAHAAEPPEAAMLVSAPGMVWRPIMYSQPVMLRSKRPLLNSTRLLMIPL